MTTELTISQRIHAIDNAMRQTIGSIDPLAPMEQVAELREQIRAYGKLVKEWSDLIDERFVECIETQQQDCTIGPIRYYVGTTKTVKANSNAAVAEAVLEAVAGDFDAFAKTLASCAFKYGAVRELVGQDRFDSLFTTEERKELETGKPKRQLKSVNENFV